MKSTSKKRTPTIENLTVKRRYLTEREIERLMDCARKHGRYGQRDATMILVAYRHGLRASEVCGLQWQQIELSRGSPACAPRQAIHPHMLRQKVATNRVGICRPGQARASISVTGAAARSTAGHAVPR